jgi:hypothetical protein
MMLRKDYGPIYYGKHHRKVLKAYAQAIEQHQTPSISLSAWSARASVKDGDTTTANERCAKIAEAVAERLGPSDFEGLVVLIMAEVDLLEAVNAPLAPKDEYAVKHMRLLVKRLAVNGGYCGLEREPDPHYHE